MHQANPPPRVESEGRGGSLMTTAPSRTRSEEGVVSGESPPPRIESEGRDGIGRVAVTGKENPPLA